MKCFAAQSCNPMPLVDDDEFLVAACQWLATIRTGNHHIFNTGRERMELGNAWFDGEQHSFLQWCFVAFGEEGGFMHIHTNAVTKTMAEFFTITCVFNYFTGSGINL